MSNTFKGVAHVIGAPETKSDKFSFRKFIVKDDSNPQYPNVVEFQFANKSMDKLNDINPGDEVEVHYNLRGREWTNQQGEVKYFVSLDGWRVDVLKKAAASNTGFDPNQKYDDEF